MTKKERQQLILQVIEQSEIDTQEELAMRVNELGAKATQATVSRDIKELNLVKVNGKTKKFKYSKVNLSDSTISERSLQIVREAVISVEDANNLVVLKTISGNAMSVATIIDKHFFETTILGTIAGDDTLLIITKTSKEATFLTKKFLNLIEKNA